MFLLLSICTPSGLPFSFTAEELEGISVWHLDLLHLNHWKIMYSVLELGGYLGSLLFYIVHFSFVSCDNSSLFGKTNGTSWYGMSHFSAIM
jgi:hypothetical protein